MIDIGTIVGALESIFDETLQIFDRYGFSIDKAAELKDEMRSLASLAIDPATTPDMRERALRGLKGIPIRVRQNAIAASEAAKDDMLNKVEKVAELLVGAFKGVISIFTYDE